MFTYYKLNNLRVVLGALCGLSVVFAPWWIPLIIAILLNLRFRAWETVAAGIFMDLIWMPYYPSFTAINTLPFATILSMGLLLVLEPVRRRLLIGPEIL